jgi:hypothetical protein
MAETSNGNRGFVIPAGAMNSAKPASAKRSEPLPVLWIPSLGV